MKKLTGILSMSIGIVILSVFISSYEKTETSTDEKLDYSVVSKYLSENVYPELEVLAPYSAKKSFSRCPSGFSQSMDTDKTGNVLAFGTIYNAEGCSRVEFCDYKVDMVNKEAYLKNLDDKEYMAMDKYIEGEKEKKTAKI